MEHIGRDSSYSAKAVLFECYLLAQKMVLDTDSFLNHWLNANESTDVVFGLLLLAETTNVQKYTNQIMKIYSHHSDPFMRHLCIKLLMKQPTADIADFLYQPIMSRFSQTPVDNAMEGEYITFLLGLMDFYNHEKQLDSALRAFFNVQDAHRPLFAAVFAQFALRSEAELLDCLDEFLSKVETSQINLFRTVAVAFDLEKTKALSKLLSYFIKGLQKSMTGNSFYFSEKVYRRIMFGVHYRFCF
jgi:hypothetical protein